MATPEAQPLQLSDNAKNAESMLMRVQGMGKSDREFAAQEVVDGTETLQVTDSSNENETIPVILNISVFTQREHDSAPLEQELTHSVVTAFNTLNRVIIEKNSEEASWEIGIVVLENRNTSDSVLGYTLSYVFLPLRILMTERYTTHGVFTAGKADINWLGVQLSFDFETAVLKRDEAAAAELRTVLDFLFNKTLEAYEYELQE